MSGARLGWPESGRKQTAVYWGGPVNDGYGGRTFDDAVELSPADRNGVRWEQREELFIDASGEERRSQAVVYVAQDVETGGYLYLGELADLDSEELSDPLALDDAYEVRSFKKVPNMAGDKWMRKAWL